MDVIKKMGTSLPNYQKVKNTTQEFMLSSNQKRLFYINIFLTLISIFLRIIDIEITLYALKTGLFYEANPIGGYLIRRNIFFIYVISLSFYIAILILILHQFFKKDVSGLKIITFTLTFNFISILLVIIHNLYQLSIGGLLG